jgi:hypothetical protein
MALGVQGTWCVPHEAASLGIVCPTCPNTHISFGALKKLFNSCFPVQACESGVLHILLWLWVCGWGGGEGALGAVLVIRHVYINLKTLRHLLVIPCQ